MNFDTLWRCSENSLKEKEKEFLYKYDVNGVLTNSSKMLICGSTSWIICKDPFSRTIVAISELVYFNQIILINRVIMENIIHNQEIVQFLIQTIRRQYVFVGILFNIHRNTQSIILYVIRKDSPLVRLCFSLGAFEVPLQVYQEINQDLNKNYVIYEWQPVG
jgi:hypothetical protein